MFKFIMSAEELLAALMDNDLHDRGPDRELDDRIWRWVNEHHIHGPGWRYDLEEAPRYTESLDAAYSLLPADGEPPQVVDFILEHTNGGMTIGARAGTSDPAETFWGESDAIALTGAAIRAHLELFGRN